MDESFGARLRATLNLIPAHTWYAAPSGALTFVNKRCADYLGLSADHPLRFGVGSESSWAAHSSLLHPDDHDETRRVWSTCLRTSSPDEVSFRLRDAEGEYRWFLSRAEPCRALNGRPLCWIGINLDVDDSRKAQFYLAEGQRLAHTGSWAFNAVGFDYWSSELFRIHGLEPGNRAPTTAEYLALVHPEDRQAVVREIQKTLEQQADFDFTKRIVRPDGAIRHVRCVGTLAAPSGSPPTFIGTGVDVTEREQLASARRSGEDELRQVLDLTPLLVTVYGPKRKRIYANRVALTYYGVTLDEWQQEDQGSDVHPEDLERLHVPLEHAFANRHSFEVEARLRKADGSYRWFLARGQPLCDDQGELTRWYIASADIDDRKRSEERLQQENVALREEIEKASMFEEIVGASPALASVLSRVSKVAGSDSTVLITGETGTGKELVARAIHRRSSRSSRAFVAVNCAAIPRELIASELFGHEKGAFTGATQRRPGRFELAEGGTLFLDEVGELPPETQVALLRVLQEREFERVGGTQSIRVDVRIIAATNRDLSAAIDSASFREDLFYRLNVFPLEVPPLRDRTEDIPLLVKYFIERYARKAGKVVRRVNKRALRSLQAYPWPGNVRELQNVIERSVILGDTDEFTVDESWLATKAAIDSRKKLSISVAAHEKAIVEDALRATAGRVFGPSGAAARLGIPRSTLESKIRSLKINKSRFRKKVS